MEEWPTLMTRLCEECNWQTHGDPVLISMANAAVEFTASVKDGEPRWLTFIGRSGTGKTYLSKGIAKWCELRYRTGWAEFRYWPQFLSKMRTPGCHVASAVRGLSEHRLLVIDEIGMGSDNRDFGVDLLLRVMESRRNSATIFTSNATIKQLAATDERIASRLIRNGDVVECNTTDYSMRRTGDDTLQVK